LDKQNSVTYQINKVDYSLSLKGNDAIIGTRCPYLPLGYYETDEKEFDIYTSDDIIDTSKINGGIYSTYIQIKKTINLHH
jgi:hypothetical protein